MTCGKKKWIHGILIHKSLFIGSLWGGERGWISEWHCYWWCFNFQWNLSIPRWAQVYLDVKSDDSFCIEEVDKCALIVLWMYLMLWINLSSVTIGSCDFEHGLCTWTEAQSGDDFDWKQGSGRTTSGGTGPSSDHTLQSSSGMCSISHGFLRMVWL